VATPAFAVREWYDFYLQARDQDIPRKRWGDCVQDLEAALRLRPEPGLNVRTYGQWFEEYLPHYYMGLCLLRQEDYQKALAAFDRAEEAGAVLGSGHRKDLARLRNEAQSAENARLTREARSEVQRLLERARDLGRRRSWDEGLSQLARAEVLARGLDTETLASVNREQDRLRTAQREAKEAAARAQRIQQQLEAGESLLEEGRSTEAMAAFDDVLGLDPRNARAREGHSVAQERILASTTRAERERAYAEGKSLFDANQYEAALRPLTDAAADPTFKAARDLLERDRQAIERLRQVRERQQEINRLFAKGEALLNAGQSAEASVAFGGVLQLDPGHARAREQLEEAERRTGEALLARWLPNLDPTLALFEPEATVVEGKTFTLQGVATDDRGLRKVEFRQGDKVVDQIVIDDDAPTPVKQQRFVKELSLAPGANDIAVTATDVGGLTRTVRFTVERRLRFYETQLFLPSAGAAAFALVGAGFVSQRLRRRRARRRRFNPYIAGAPVLDEDMFYGRDKLTARMLSTLHRNSLMITGERRIGKTTFLHHLAKVLAADDAGDWQFFPVYVDLQGVPERAFFHALMAEVVETLDLSLPTLNSLRLRPDPSGYESREFGHDLKQIIAELQTRTSRKIKLALLIDEVDVLNQYSDSVNQRLRGIFMRSFSENLVAVMSGVGIKRRWKSEVSPWYNFFDEIELAPFTREEAEALIREPVAGVFRWKSEAVERILELSRLRPYLVQKYCVHALNHMLENGRGTIRGDDVEVAREAVVLEEAQDSAEAKAPADGVSVAD
jgi:tetratricopeptide (TPR) repeat protein/Cdc6-like AAA superfamily ATPase